jgi:hypothetical protein
VRQVLEAIRGAAAASGAVQSDQRKADRLSLKQLLADFEALKRSLTNRILKDVTDFRRMNLQALLADVDKLIAETEAQILKATAADLETSAERGRAAVDEPAKAAGVIVTPALPGLDRDLVIAGFGNTADLLSLPMKQFGAEVKAGLRRVSLAGDNRFEEIQKLRDKIAGQGFDNAQFRAERIIRTEVGRVFNAAQFARMEELAKTFPFLRKGWRATKDGRTRTGHREAGNVYARGAGIPVSDLFAVNVYDEGSGTKAPKLIGTAKLRYPLDPNVQPAGKVGAGATIMCRCNGFVDLNAADLSAYNAQRVKLALGGVAPPAPLPVPQPPPAPITLAPPPKPKKVRIPKAPAPKPLQAVIPKPPAKGSSAQGPAVSASLLIPSGAGTKGQSYDDVTGGVLTALRGAHDSARQALAVIDSVHGDGNLHPLPFKVNRSNLGQYVWIPLRGSHVLNLSTTGSALHPLMTISHEVGHWLDNMAVAKGPGAKPKVETVKVFKRKRGGGIERPEVTRLAIQDNAPAGYTRIGQHTSSDRHNAVPEVKALKDAIAASRSYSTIYANRRLIHNSAYYLKPEEAYARAYSQYIATKSQDPTMLRELANMRTSDAKAGIERQWDEADFRPILQAFDKLFASLGWIKP